jgi:hypothetical protein
MTDAFAVGLVRRAQAPVVAVVSAGGRDLQKIPLVALLERDVGGGQRFGFLILSWEMPPQSDGNAVDRLAVDRRAECALSISFDCHCDREDGKRPWREAIQC